MLTGGFVYALMGPLFRVETLASSGTRFTPTEAIDARLAEVNGSSMLTLDTRALANGIEALPGVAEARIETTLPGTVSVAVREDEPVIVWSTATAFLAIASDGGVVGAFSDADSLPADVAGLPLIEDSRGSTGDIGVGDRLDAVETRAALRLATVDPALLGSDVPALSVRVDDLYGFVLVAPERWEAALGFYGREPGDDAEAATARIERQIAAVRTLFADQPEASVVWLDARNPGKIYFRATEG
ncbi:MAG TPA: FtsQ-type POTRA domain-containing protein [Actinomycetota bacterium]|nr:FtsQ-type POTRA domain-containing protein [Actinomycetota bacterium]